MKERRTKPVDYYIKTIAENSIHSDWRNTTLDAQFL